MWAYEHFSIICLFIHQNILKENFAQITYCETVSVASRVWSTGCFSVCRPVELSVRWGWRQKLWFNILAVRESQTNLYYVSIQEKSRKGKKKWEVFHFWPCLFQDFITVDLVQETGHKCLHVFGKSLYYTPHPSSSSFLCKSLFNRW